MKIWDAILEGCKTTDKVVGFVFNEGKKREVACAIGAAFIGAHAKQIAIGHHDYCSLALTLFPELIADNIPCPNCRGWYRPITLILHLNDQEAWRREDIAFFLREELEPEATSEIVLQEAEVTA